jgi:hypothetical protein
MLPASRKDEEAAVVVGDEVERTLTSPPKA